MACLIRSAVDLHSRPACPVYYDTQVNEVKVVLAHNIDLVLVRGEKLEQLADKTEDLTFEVGGCRTGAGSNVSTDKNVKGGR